MKYEFQYDTVTMTSDIRYHHLAFWGFFPGTAFVALGVDRPGPKTPFAILQWVARSPVVRPLSVEWSKPTSLAKSRKFLVRATDGEWRFIRTDEACEKPGCPRDPEVEWVGHSHSKDYQVVAYAVTEATVNFADGSVRKVRVTFVGEPLGKSGGYTNDRTGLRAHSHFPVVEEITE